MKSNSLGDDLNGLMLRHLEGATLPEEARQLSMALRNSAELRRDSAAANVA